MEAYLSSPYTQVILGVFIGGIVTFLKMRKSSAPTTSPFVEPLLNLAKDAFKVATADYFSQLNQLDSLPSMSAEERKLRAALSEEYIAVTNRLANNLIVTLGRFDADMSAEELVRTAQEVKKQGKLTTVCL